MASHPAQSENLTEGISHPSLPATSPSRRRRLRPRKACEPCRDRKRKCDGNYPCSTCVRLEYDCYFASVRRRAEVGNVFRRAPASTFSDRAARPGINEDDDSEPKVADDQLTTLEANSPAAFVRKLALALDPANAPRLHLFAWNLFLGGRTSNRQPCVLSVVEILSHSNMESLASIYLAKVDPCYGFIDRKKLQQMMSSRWTPNSAGGPYDAVLCGVAALGLLFSRIRVENAEIDLVETAKHILERSNDARPSIDIVSGWVLRVAYLRITASPHIAWMASCAMMHALEASGIHFPQSAQSIAELPQHNEAPELCGRVFGIARHLNIWISYDLGRSRIVLPQAQSGMPSARPGDYTTELLNLLPVSELLGPDKSPSASDLKAALRNVLAGEHTEPPSVMAQCNLSLLLMRRLRGLDFLISGAILDDVLRLISRALQAVETLLITGNPWHHVANVPFQIVCILLSIDTPPTLAHLGDAVKTLNNVAQTYETEATREALNTACLLIHLHQKRKSTDAASLAEVLRTYWSLPSFGIQDGGGSYPNWNEWEGVNNASWLDDLMTDLPNLQDFDVNQLLGDSSHLNLPPQW